MGEAKELAAIDADVSSNNSTDVSKLAVDEKEDLHGFMTELDSMPKGYYYSAEFWGTMFAVGFAIMGGTGGFALAAPNLAFIDADIGPDPNNVWISLVNTLTMAVFMLLVGRLSDLFGRRWLMIGGQILAIIGCIVAATASSVPIMIGAMVLIGIAASAQQCFAIICNEIVPMRFRFLATSFMYIFTLPVSAFGPVISKAFIVNTGPGWRTSFWFMVGVNGLSLLLYYFFYHPPTFNMKFGSRTQIQQVKNVDYVGILLFAAGLTLFILGLSWGGSVYPWKSAATISTIVIGSCCLIVFVFWELYGPVKEPLIPMHLFKNLGWVTSMINLGLGASVYYGMAIIWPSMIAVVYTNDGGASIHSGMLASLIGVMIVAGQLFAGPLVTLIGKTKYQCMFVLITGGGLLASVASCGTEDFTRAAVLISLGCFLIGWNEAVCLVNSGIEVADQQELGTALGLAGSIRSAISTIASTVYVLVLKNRLAVTIPEKVPAALIEAGLPASSVGAFMGGFATGSFEGISGLTPTITSVGLRAYKDANAAAYSTVFLTSLAFSGIAICLSFWNPNVEEKMTNEVAATLNNKGDNQTVITEKTATMGV
ncbi:hypothetical protein FQN57_001506 [Myotisia sp. PD_48]|nr:hypothetical protein FQN57_001506 [Myotisia sp. PD_48]